jgi:hypothetical protein
MLYPFDRISEIYLLDDEELRKTNPWPWMLVEYGSHATAHYDWVV